MENCDDTQELFLLEFLVDRVNIPSVQAMSDDVLLVKTCIEFKILNLPPMYVCQETSNNNCCCLGADPQVFRKGKSCLFALPSKVLKPPICSFPITMTVYKKLPPTVLPDIMTIGTCQIDIRDMLNCLLQESTLTTPNPCKTIKNNFQIYTATGQCVGEICVFVRFSRLGKKVVTQFQNPHNKKPYLFKGAEDSPIFQCKKVSSTILEEDGLNNCSCEKKANDREEENPPRNCCETDTRHKKRSSSRAKCSKKRPCCPTSHKHESKKREALKECHSENQTRTSKGFFEMPSEKETRQCGCEVKEDKTTSCKK